MLSISSATLDAWITGFIWPLARVLGLIATAPILGNSSVPVRIKVSLGVLITVCLASVLPAVPGIAPTSAVGILILARESIIGLSMGFALRLVFAAVDSAGELIGLQMGLGFATFFDPQSHGQTVVIGQLLGLLASLTFLAMNGHLLMLAALAESFQAMPLAAPLPDSTWFLLANWGGRIFTIAVQLALPLIGTMLIVNLALGVLTRAAPQLNLFAVGFPLTLSVGLLVLAWWMPLFAPGVERLIESAYGMLFLGRR